MNQFILFLMLWITTILASSASSSPSQSHSTQLRIAQQWTHCPNGTIYLNRRVMVAGCYPEVSLYQKCQANLQCTSKVPNSFCGFYQHDAFHQCICADGFEPTADNTTCLPIHVCSITTTNPTYLKADCPLETEFCESSRCLCRASYKRDSTGSCIWSVPDEDEPKKVQPASNWFTELHNELQTIKWFEWLFYFLALVCFAILSVALFILLPVFICKQQKSISRVVKQAPELARQLSKDHQNSGPVYVRVENEDN